MNCVIDIGNTTIAFAVVGKSRIKETYRMLSNDGGKSFLKKIRKILIQITNEFGKPGHVIVCSVVPSALVILEKEVSSAWNMKTIVIGRDITVPIKNLYRFPKQVGQDRLVGAYAAKMIYGTPAIVIDLGTAITFDVVSKKGEYLGGAIVPGIRLSLESLHLKTALLPKIKIQAPKQVIGKNTKESMLSGIFYGYGCLCRGLIELIHNEIGGHPKVIMTGGHTELMKRFIDRKIRIVDEDIVFKGLNFLIPQ